MMILNLKNTLVSMVYTKYLSVVGVIDYNEAIDL